jgi:dihydroorotate dehydrogenase (fumarate)
MNASGCWCTTEKELDELYNSNCAALVSKSGTINSRTGNSEPRLYVDSMGSINAMGLPNLGYKFYLDYGKKVINKPFIQSIHPFSIDELDIMLKDIDLIKTKRLVEVNVTCPNIVNGGNENSFENFEKYMDRIKQMNLQNVKCGLKLSPIYELDHFDRMSNLLLKYDIGFITCVNSVPNGLIIDPINEITRIFPKGGVGGIGGSYIKPIALSNVYNFHKRIGNTIDIIGCGGINRGFDAFEYILCGAKAVQVGTHLVKDKPKCFDIINYELEYLMKAKNYDTVDDFRGKLKIVDMI